ncbi:molybdate ABC transporter substrate-binding protein [Alkalihalobacterium elongatum]|uniref:molybdate ABC transporter substrate-binding protein n=1 Tax=Alkalihalobacterium elongatum TaxID=2675466 RepID=UPI001C1FBFB3|nr:molybdate ABC transporter substrate-binding protein [Alkalihalobacterium elongatum]
MNVKILTLLTVLGLIILINTACGTVNNSPEDSIELKIAAASGLTLPFTEIGQAFEQETGVKVTFSFGSTGQLADQILNGAPFDVFAAADIKFINNLAEKELIVPKSKKIHALGRIGMATLPDQEVIVETLHDLLKPEIKKIAIANPEHAPYGLAAKQSLEKAGIWEELQGKMVYGRNISDTLAYIETGNAEAGIIALSLYNEDAVNFHIIDDTMHAPVEQSIAVVRSTNQVELAHEFIEFTMGPIGKPIMENYGFIVPE